MTKCRYCRSDVADDKGLCDSPICQAKRELSEYRYLFRKASDMGDMVDELRSAIQGCSVSLEQLGSCGTRRNTFEARMARYIDIKEQYEKFRDEAYNKALSVEMKIRELDNPYSDILRLKYIKLWTFEKIAVELNYDYRWTIRLYNKALKTYSEIKIDH